MIAFQRPDGASVEAYLIEPAYLKNAPGIIVIQEWWGLDDEIKNVANRLAKQATALWFRISIAANLL